MQFMLLRVKDSILFSPVCLFFRKTRLFLYEYVTVRHTVADTVMMMLAPTVMVTVIHAILAFEARALKPPIGTLVGEELVSNIYRSNKVTKTSLCYHLIAFCRNHLATYCH